MATNSKNYIAQYVLKHNAIANINSITGGYVCTDEGRVYIIQECTFTVLYKTHEYRVEASHVDDDHDMYSISVYNNKTGGELSHAYLDSTGGGSSDEFLCIFNGTNRLVEVEDAILDVLFGNKELCVEPLIKAF